MVDAGGVSSAAVTVQLLWSLLFGYKFYVLIIQSSYEIP